MDRAAAAYFAGFFDGEGTITATRFGNTAPPKPSLRISQKALAPLEYLHAMYGGTLGKQAPTHLGSGVSFLQLQGAAAEEFLKDVTPYLRLKKRQAILALIAFKAKNERARLRWWLCREIKRLNHAHK